MARAVSGNQTEAVVVSRNQLMTVARAFALGFGVVYLLAGLMGFVRPLTDAGGSGFFFTGEAKLLGILSINWFHNLVHIATGLLGILAGSRHDMARNYARAVALGYAVVLIAGLFTGKLLNLMPLNGADNILHLLTVLGSGVIGFTPIGEVILGGPREATA